MASTITLPLRCSAQAVRMAAALRPQFRLFHHTPAPSMYNRVTLLGNVGRLPEYHEFSSNNEVGQDSVESGLDSRKAPNAGVWTFSVATDRNSKNSSGEWTRVTDWHRVKTYKDVGDLSPGQKVLVEGDIRYWQSGEKRGTDIHASKVVVVSRSSSPTESGLGDEGQF
ncbi:hypothetical protein BASA50_008023 [Batrachochytrium salamandrivorans]|uniref:Single-strand binding protein n=1 Tax=Batrachochytrium salamandrivorans TaxID=1357716 RepID=A0ABQ8F513_9FUNG|nr:hypothetical protein BASA60_002001 [Batrachochytrium salamandrivorans]KAH6592407.1 hypothetical protein BASA50_008023 [Batrachochytrium salamandrivorans]KAH9275706.1 hypothetical protein BASA83_002007 [Batrachochytrium salamandrivorans]